MRDDSQDLGVLELPSARAGVASGAVIIPFPTRAPLSPRQPAARITVVDPRDIELVLQRVTRELDLASAAHAPTQLAAHGALAGFAAQQMLLREGGSSWAQPKRAEHLDRLLLSESHRDGSLWFRLREAAAEVGAQHLPDPNKLLQATLRCVGTTQFGQLTLPLEYKLSQQPQSSLTRLWPVVASDVGGVAPELFAAVCARRVVIDHRVVPPHVALRIVMQAALAMALIEPRIIPGSVVKTTSG